VTCAACGAENREGAKFCDACGAPQSGVPAREQRKTVTVLFCDVTGSTSLGEKLDPESLRALLARYFERMKSVVESHGGTVEKFIGDAVMAVFGVPVLHEDDALRAVRAAVEMRAAFPELGIEGRIGVTTGEVVTGTEERLATGDAVNIAARLEQAAAPGEVLIGEETQRLVRAAVESEALEPLVLKGKSEPVPAFRVVGLRSAAPRVGTSFIGRADEFDLLRRAFDRAVRERGCHLFTLLGTAGVGKSRLVDEFLGSLGGTRVVRGRCLSYGEGITYYPVVEVLKQLLGADEELMLGELATDDVAKPLRGLLGVEAATATPVEAAWAFRKLLETVAAQQPLVVLFDDIHWGERTFLDAIEHVADLSRDAPILLLCVARPELLDRRPGWGGGKLNATTTLLEPLGASDTELLLDELGDVDDDLRERIRKAADGNPLFVEEMVAMVHDGGRDVAVPPTIQALLAARLDQLPREERMVLERGSVEGKEFHRGAVVALAPDEPGADAHLSTLVRKDLIRPDRSTLPGEDAYRFRHLLIRDAAYEALPKAARADLHERFAAWLELRGAELVEHEEIVGYHLEQAYRYKSELGEADVDLGRRASALLAAAASRARSRRDVGAQENLLERALALSAPGDAVEELELQLILVLGQRGRLEDRDAFANAVVERALARGDRVTEARARVAQAMNIGQAARPGEGEALARTAIELLTAAGHHDGLARAWRLLSIIHFNRCHNALALEAVEHAVEHARHAGDEAFVRDILEGSTSLWLLGPKPVAEGLAFLDAHPELSAMAAARRAELEALTGRIDDARASIAEGVRKLEERGMQLSRGAASMSEMDVELFAGDPQRAVEYGLAGYELLAAMGADSYNATVAAIIGWAYLDLGRDEEAESWSRKSQDLGTRDDVVNELLWQSVGGLAMARQGRIEEGERLVRAALALGRTTDATFVVGEIHERLAELLRLSGRDDEARAELEQAIALFESKGATALQARAEAALTAVRTP
jgi:class 3 adenylate cyclase/tetratricopeptide (TPR) repeat protein